MPVFAAGERQLPPKPTGPIAVSYQLSSQPVVGQALDIVVTARSAAAVGLVLEASVSEPAVLVITAQQLGADTDGQRTWVVTIVPLRAAVGYVNLLVAGEIDGVEQARSVAIPIRTVESPLRAAAADNALVNSGGEAFVLLPVDESP